jgi:hypothetical protein
MLFLKNNILIDAAVLVCLYLCGSNDLIMGVTEAGITEVVPLVLLSGFLPEPTVNKRERT